MFATSNMSFCSTVRTAVPAYTRLSPTVPVFRRVRDSDTTLHRDTAPAARACAHSHTHSVPRLVAVAPIQFRF